MLSISNVGATQAGSYYDKDGYYARMEDTDNRWFGSLTQDLGLSAELKKDDFNQLVAERGERAGFDLCFSAPKSVSIAMCMDGEIRRDMLEAHNKAVETILERIEKHEISARVTHDKVTEDIKTGNMICGRFNHYVSRASDPQLHTHAVILNKTKCNGKYYAVDNEPLYKNKIFYGQLYRNTLARELLQKGYEVKTTNREKGFFELAGIKETSMEHFSRRREEILKQLKEWGASSPQSAEKAALLTRQAKEHRDIGKLMESWKETLTQLNEKQLEKAAASTVPTKEQYTVELERSVKHLSNRLFAFKERDYEKIALAYGVGFGVTEEQVKDYFEQQQGKEIVYLGKRQDNPKDPNVYFSTLKNYEIEQEIFKRLSQSKNKLKGIVAAKVTQYLDENAIDPNGALVLSKQQQDAVIFVTTNQDQYVAVQGLAGTGKTRMLQAARKVFESNGYEVKGVCFAGKAAEGLQQDSGIASTTIHSFLNRLEKESGHIDTEIDFKEKHEWNVSGLKPGDKKEVWIVDEAGMVGNATMRSMMQAADAKNAKIVFVGDKNQLLPIAVGNSFARSVNQSQIATITIDEIQRQKQRHLLQSVRESVLGSVSKSLDILDENQDVRQIADRKDRMKEIVKEYVNLSQVERKKTIILTADNQDRNLLNTNIRKELKKTGQLLPGYVAKIEDRRGYISKREFSVDDKIIFLRNDNQLGVKNGQTGFIKEISENNVVIDTNGRKMEIDLLQYNKIDHGYVLTTYKAQGITEDRALVHIDSAQKQLNSRNGYYVDISRARYQVKLFTDARDKIEKQVQEFAKKLTSDDFLIPQKVTDLESGNKAEKINRSTFLEDDCKRMYKEILHQRMNLKLEAVARSSSEELIKNMNNALDKKVKEYSFTNS